MTELFATLLGGVTLLNRIITTGILITAFALVIYIGLYNRRSQIARRGNLRKRFAAAPSRALRPAIAPIADRMLLENRLRIPLRRMERSFRPNAFFRGTTNAVWSCRGLQSMPHVR